MAVPLIAVAISAFSNPVAIAGLSALGAGFVGMTYKQIEEHKGDFNPGEYESAISKFSEISSLNSNITNNTATSDNSYISPNGLSMTREEYFGIQNMIKRITRTGVMTPSEGARLTKYGYTLNIHNATNDKTSYTLGSIMNETVSNEIASLKEDIAVLKDTISSLQSNLSSYIDKETFNNSIFSLQNQISSIRSGASDSSTSSGGLIGAINQSTAKLNTISEILFNLKSATEEVASKTGSFTGELKLAKSDELSKLIDASGKTNTSDYSSGSQSINIDFSKPMTISGFGDLVAVQRSILEAQKNQSVTLDMSKPMTIEGFSDLVAAQTGLKELEDARVKREEAAVEIEKARVKREEEAHDILKEKTDFLTKPRVIRDMDGNELANAIPREMALTHQASLARTYTDENTLTSDDIDFGNFDLEIPEFFKTLKPGLATDIILNSDIKNTQG